MGNIKISSKKTPFKGDVLTIHLDLVANREVGNTGNNTFTSDPHQSGLVKEIVIEISSQEPGSEEMKLIHTLKGNSRAYVMSNLTHILSQAVLDSGWARNV